MLKEKRGVVISIIVIIFALSSLRLLLATIQIKMINVHIVAKLLLIGLTPIAYQQQACAKIIM